MKKNVWQTIIYIIAILIWVGDTVIASQFIIGLPMLWIFGSDIFSKPIATTIHSALSYILAAIIITTVPRLISKKHRKHKQNLREEFGLKGLPTWTDIGLAPVGFIVYLLIAAAIMLLFKELFPWFNAEETQDVGFSIYIAGFDRVVAFLTLVVVAPFFEEIIFRGWLYSKLRSKLNQNLSDTVSMIISICLVSLLFGIVHLQWNVGVNVFAMSIVLCILREITGTTYAGIILHMLKNGLAFYLLFVLGIGA